jgi:hypothetical protein
MKRCFSVLTLALLTATVAFAAPSEARLSPVRATHQRVRHHHAHKAAKHHQPKRSHRAV